MTLIAEWSNSPEFHQTMKDLIWNDMRAFHCATHIQVAASVGEQERMIEELIAGGYLERCEVAGLCKNCGLKKESCDVVESVTAGRAKGALLLRYKCGYTQCSHGPVQPYPDSQP